MSMENRWLLIPWIGRWVWPTGSATPIHGGCLPRSMVSKSRPRALYFSRISFLTIGWISFSSARLLCSRGRACWAWGAWLSGPSALEVGRWSSTPWVLRELLSESGCQRVLTIAGKRTTWSLPRCGHWRYVVPGLIPIASSYASRSALYDFSTSLQAAAWLGSRLLAFSVRARNLDTNCSVSSSIVQYECLFQI
jgi:hypothetical protein